MKLFSFCKTANLIKLPNLNEEIAAMAIQDSAHPPTLSSQHVHRREEEKLNTSSIKSNAEKPYKRKKCRAKLVQEIRISVSHVLLNMKKKEEKKRN